MVLKSFLLSVFFTVFINTVYANEFILGFYGFPVKSDIDMILGSAIQYLMPQGTDGKEEIFLEDYLQYAEKKGVKKMFLEESKKSTTTSNYFLHDYKVSLQRNAKAISVDK